MDREEFKNIYDLYFDELRRYLLYRSGNTEIATDIAQEVFMKCWEKRSSIRIETSKALLYKIANDMFISQYRKEKQGYNFFKNFIYQEETDYSPQEKLEFEELKIRFEKALINMPEKQRTVFLMNRVEKITYKEIADKIGLSVKGVEKRMNLALNYLKDSFSRG